MLSLKTTKDILCLRQGKNSECGNSYYHLFKMCFCIFFILVHLDLVLTRNNS